jgi:hypothetical protein
MKNESEGTKLLIECINECRIILQQTGFSTSFNRVLQLLPYVCVLKSSEAAGQAGNRSEEIQELMKEWAEASKKANVEEAKKSFYDSE